MLEVGWDSTGLITNVCGKFWNKGGHCSWQYLWNLMHNVERWLLLTSVTHSDLFPSSKLYASINMKTLNLSWSFLLTYFHSAQSISFLRTWEPDIFTADNTGAGICKWWESQWLQARVRQRWSELLKDKTSYLRIVQHITQVAVNTYHDKVRLQ